MATDISSLLDDLIKLAEKIKTSIPPHKPDLNKTEASIVSNPKFLEKFGRPWQLERESAGRGEFANEGDEAAKEEERKQAERAAATRERDLQLAALSGDLNAIRSQMGDAKFVELTADCFQSVGAAALGGSLLGKPAELALIELLRSPNCRKTFIESYRRIVNDVSRMVDKVREAIERDRVERMIRAHDEYERQDLRARTV